MEKKVVDMEPAAEAKQPSGKKVAAGKGELVSGRTLGLVMSAAILVAVLTLTPKSTFLSTDTMAFISNYVAFWAMLALAQAMCLVVGGMNLSVGAICSITTVVLGLCLDSRYLGLSGCIAVPIMMLAGCVAGWINGLLIVKLKINSFIVTLSTMFVYMGLRSGISGGDSYNRLPQSFKTIGNGTVAGLGVPYLILVVVAVLAVMAFVFNRTVFGRRLLATGGNAEAAKLSGVDTDKMTVWANVLSGLFAALAAALYASYMGVATPGTGDDWVIISFAVAIIGGTGLSGGLVSMTGILMGGVIVQLIKYGIVQVMKSSDYYANCFLGASILLAIVVDRVRETYDEKARSSAGRAGRKTGPGQDTGP